MSNTNPIFVQPEAVFAPVVKANKIAVANLEKLVGFYQNILPGYVDFSLSQLKAATEVSDVETAQVFYKSQAEAVKTLGDKLTADSKALTDLVTGFVNEYSSFAKESAAEFTPKAVKKAA